MTEYDAVSLFLQYVSQSLQVVVAYVSVLSAFLVMSYFAAAKLSSWLVTIVLALLTFVSLLLLMQLYLLRHDMVLMYQFLLEQKAQAMMTLPWFGTNPPWAVRFLGYLYQIVGVGGYLGALAFFFFQRSQANQDSRGRGGLLRRGGFRNGAAG